VSSRAITTVPRDRSILLIEHDDAQHHLTRIGEEPLMSLDEKSG
jgi:hypothetical protein